MRPDPSVDNIIAIFFTLCKDVSKSEPVAKSSQSGVFIVDPNCHQQNQDGSTSSEQNGVVNRTILLIKTGYSISFQRCYKTEKDMLLAFAEYVREIDPDFCIGYEVQLLSWGYLIERGAVLDLNMCQLLSRVVSKEKMQSRPLEQNAENWFGQLVNMTITGRIILNVWRVMRSEVYI